MIRLKILPLALLCLSDLVWGSLAPTLALKIQLEPDTQKTLPLILEDPGVNTFVVVEEAVSDCSDAPQPLDWVQADPTRYNDQGGSTSVDVAFDSGGVAPGTVLTGLLCLVIHDASGIGIPPSPTEQVVQISLEVVDSVHEIPLLEDWGLAALFLALGFAAVIQLRRL